MSPSERIPLVRISINSAATKTEKMDLQFLQQEKLGKFECCWVYSHSRQNSDMVTSTLISHLSLGSTSKNEPIFSSSPHEERTSDVQKPMNE